jgi:energy-coupling factor transport system substrate-specific component
VWCGSVPAFGRPSLSRLVVAGCVAAALVSAAWAANSPANAALPVLLVAAALVAAVVAWLETGPFSAKELTIAATVGGVAAASRIVFAAVPNVKPATTIVVIAGVALGLRAGVLAGAITAFVSDMFLGQGPWTPWHILGWAACGAVGALLAPLLRRRLALAAVCFALGFAFDFLLDVQGWWSLYPHTRAAFVALVVRGLWFDLAHATGNAAFALLAGAELRRVLERYGRRLRTEVVWA